MTNDSGVYLRMPAKLKEELEKLAESQGLSLSAIIRKTMIEELNRDKRRKRA